jgi:hypothetical protein
MRRAEAGGDQQGACGGVSITAACGGLVCGVSVKAKAEPATAQPAIKAIRLSFMIVLRVFC